MAPTTTQAWDRMPPLKKTVLHRKNLRVEEAESVSIMFSVLPSMLQNKLNRIPSIRKTVSIGSIRHIRHVFSSGTTTPLSEAETEVMDAEGTHQVSVSDGLTFSTTNSFSSMISTLPALGVNGASGVDWRCGGQGVDLITNAGRESRCGIGAEYNSPFERTAYVDGVSYMLRGLPRDLDETEVAVLRRSMPEPLADALPGSSMPREHKRRPLREGNFVHNLLFNILMFLHVWICWAMPHALYLAGELMRFERANKITEHVLSAVVTAVNALRRIGDGIAGQVISDVCEYMAQGISGALKEFAQEKSEPGKTR